MKDTSRAVEVEANHAYQSSLYDIILEVILILPFVLNKFRYQRWDLWNCGRLNLIPWRLDGIVCKVLGFSVLYVS